VQEFYLGNISFVTVAFHNLNNNKNNNTTEKMYITIESMLQESKTEMIYR